MTVDVRDDAACHVGLLESDKVANGERYLAMSTETRSYEDICASIDRVLPELRHDPGPIVDPSPERWKERRGRVPFDLGRASAAQRPHPGRGADHVPPARRLDPRLRRVTPRRRQCDPEPPTRLNATLDTPRACTRRKVGIRRRRQLPRRRRTPVAARSRLARWLGVLTGNPAVRRSCFVGVRRVFP